MNFYKHHIGDYAAATAHLSMLEDGAFRRLLCVYYRDEKPLPLDTKAVQRLVGARSKDERAAVETVLEEFFTRTGDGWRNKRADEEISRANAQADTNRRIAEEREARRKAAKGARIVHESSDESSPVREPSQTPDSRLQTKATTPETSTLAHGSSPAHTPERAREEAPPPRVEPAPQPTEAGRACLLMRQAGCAVGTNPAHPDLLAALAEGVTPEDLAATVREAIEGGKGRPFNWAITTARSRRAQGAKPITTMPVVAGQMPSNVTSIPSKRMRGIMALEALKHDPLV
jgi:uncharacterized protein YdaU (DUF1376 family)